MINIQKTEEEWQRELTPEQYEVMRQKGTEAPFTGKYYHINEKGMYVCAACGNELFLSENKFDSGTGWPSFDTAIGVETRTDTSHGMIRTEVVCKKCGAHLGHLFDDGPKETTGQRFCINSCALDLRSDPPS